METPVFNENGEDLDQMLHSVVSDQGPHCLPMSHLGDTRHKWFNLIIQTNILMVLSFQNRYAQ